MRAFAVAGLLFLLTAPALASEPEETQVFHCVSRSAKTITVCQAPTDVVYRFGSANGAAEMTVRVPTEQLKWQRDYGSGGGSEDIHFPNGGVTHQITYAKTGTQGTTKQKPRCSWSSRPSAASRLPAQPELCATTASS